MSFSIFSTISQSMKTKFFIFFGHKYVETRPNCSYELATFLKYHMPLNGKPYWTQMSKECHFDKRHSKVIPIERFYAARQTSCTWVYKVSRKSEVKPFRKFMPTLCQPETVCFLKIISFSKTVQTKSYICSKRQKYRKEVFGQSWKNTCPDE